MSYSKGIMWLDDCRIPFVNGGWVRRFNENSIQTNPYHGVNNSTREGMVENNIGRFTPNLLVCDDMLNDGSVSKSVKGGKGKPLTNHNGITDKMMRPNTIQERGGFDDKGTNSRYYDLDLWFDKMLEKL